MHRTTIEADVRSIIAAETGSPHLAVFDSSTQLREAGFDAPRFLRKLGVEAQEEPSSDSMTMGDLVSLLESKPGPARETLGNLATEARVRRLLEANLVTSGQEPSLNETSRWWYGLATQILWWYAREQSVTLVQRGLPARASQSLIGLGLLEVETLAEDQAENAATFIDVLERLEYSEGTAARTYKSMVRVAQKISGEYDGRVQGALRRYADQMVDAITLDLLADSSDSPLLKEAFRSWISVATSLPTSVWSPSTDQFVRKFTDADITEGMLTRAVDEIGLNPLAVDDSLANFMEGVCRTCDPDDETHQYCVRRWADLGLEVECPGRPDLAYESLAR